MPLLLTLLALIALILLVAWGKLDTFIAFVLVSLGFGLAAGLDVTKIASAITRGIGNTLGSLVIILGFGAMLGKLVADSGAAQRIATTFIAWAGTARLSWALALAGFVVGIPLFFSAGFVILVPLVFTAVAAARLPLVPVALPMVAALSVAHGYLPPHPAPTAIAQQLHASLSLTLIYGILIAVPAIIVGGPLFVATLMKRVEGRPPVRFLTTAMPEAQLPGLGVSLVAALMPLLLLGGSAIVKPALQGVPAAATVLDAIGEPHIAMLLSLLAAVYLLGLRRGHAMPAIMRQLDLGFREIASILLVIGGAGGFMQVLSDSGVNTYIGQQLETLAAPPLVVGWAMAAVIRVCVGSATVAGLTTVGLMLPLIARQPVSPELLTLAIGAGSLMCSHLNDGGFWLFKEYFDLSIRDTLATWSLMETIVSIMGLLGVLALQLVI